MRTALCTGTRFQRRSPHEIYYLSDKCSIQTSSNPCAHLRSAKTLAKQRGIYDTTLRVPDECEGGKEGQCDIIEPLRKEGTFTYSFFVASSCVGKFIIFVSAYRILLRLLMMLISNRNRICRW